MPFTAGNTLGNRFAKGQTGNPTGRPKSLLNEINSKLPIEGIERITKTDFKNTIQFVMAMTESELKEIETDTEQPIWLRWIIRDLFDKKTRTKTMIDLRNFVFGK